MSENTYGFYDPNVISDSYYQSQLKHAEQRENRILIRDNWIRMSEFKRELRENSRGPMSLKLENSTIETFKINTNE